jgi:hypothetical protein
MPFGLQVTGAFRDDARLLSWAAALEAAFAGDAALCRPRPDLAQLKAVHAPLTSIVTHPPVFDGQATAVAGQAAV